MIFTSFVARYLYPEIIIVVFLILLLSIDQDWVQLTICLFFICGLQAFGKSSIFLKERDREGRRKAYAVVIVSYLLCATIQVIFFQGSVFTYSAICMFVGSLLLAFLNNYRKVSVHCGSISIVVSMASVIFFPYGLIALPLIPLMVWARVEEGFHTREEALIGSLAGIVTPLVISFLYNLLY